jgi:hypothetical protein
MDPLNQVIFDNKTFSDLLKEIHTNQKKKGKQIDTTAMRRHKLRITRAIRF